MLDEDYNFFSRNENVNTDSDSISNFKEDASTYMGVKTIQEGTVADTNKKETIKKKTIKKRKYKKKKKKRKSSSFSESSYSSSSSSSESDLYLNEDIYIEKNGFNKDEKLNIENKEKINEENNDKSKKEINTEFFWDEGGNNIYLTGSFCNWKEFFLMEKNENGIYRINLMLPPGFHQYKFKIDNIWAYSQKQPKFEDNNGNVNNFIDTTNYINTNKTEEKKTEKSPKKKIKEKTNSIGEKTKEKENKTKNIKRNQSTNSIGVFTNSNYSTYIPLKGELSIKPSALPGLYKTHYILTEKKNKKILERKFSQIEYVDQKNNPISNFLQNNGLYVNFQNLYHIHSNHLHTKEIVDLKNTVTSIITRYRAKFSTFIYYNDKKQKERNDKRHSKTFKLNIDLDDKISQIVKNTIYK